MEDTFEVSCNEGAAGVSFFGGYQFHNYIAIEYGYRLVSGFDLDIDNFNGDIEITTFDIGIRGNVPSRSSAGGYFTWKVGIESWELELELSTSSGIAGVRESISVTGDDTDVYYGVGWGLNLFEVQGSPTNGLMVEYTQHSLDGDDFDALSFSWIFYL